MFLYFDGQGVSHPGDRQVSITGILIMCIFIRVDGLGSGSFFSFLRFEEILMKHGIGPGSKGVIPKQGRYQITRTHINYNYKIINTHNKQHTITKSAIINTIHHKPTYLQSLNAFIPVFLNPILQNSLTKNPYIGSPRFLQDILHLWQLQIQGNQAQQR